MSYETGLVQEFGIEPVFFPELAGDILTWKRFFDRSPGNELSPYWKIGGKQR
jgi:hypothetical protein